MAGSLGLPPRLQNVASKGAWMCLLPSTPKPQTTSSGCFIWKGQGGLPWSTGSASSSQTGSQGRRELAAPHLSFPGPQGKAPAPVSSPLSRGYLSQQP